MTNERNMMSLNQLSNNLQNQSDEYPQEKTANQTLNMLLNSYQIAPLGGANPGLVFKS